MIRKMSVMGLALLSLVSASISVQAAQNLSTAEARSLSKQAYLYGFPMVDNYRILYSYAVDKSDPEYKGPMNQVHSTANVYTPADKAVQTPNSDTPYSTAILDLRAEPVVVTLPAIEKSRYYSVQMIDLYTFNFDYLGTRATGNGGGDFLVAGPNWKGEIPKGIKKVSRADTELVLLLYRTQLFNSADLENVKKIQAGYKATTLSNYLKQPAPPAAPPIDFLKPLSPADERKSLEFFNVLNFVLTLCPTVPSEVELRKNFAKIGIEPGNKLQVAKLSPVIEAAMKQGMVDGQKEIESTIDSATSSADWFGTREFMKNNYLLRAAAAQGGIYGNSKDEAFYIIYKFDSDKALLSGANRYTLRFEPGKLPPAKAFWSVTMYDMPAQLLVENPINRYLINSPMLPSLKKDADGGLTIYIQNESPGPEKESNWLPAPKGEFFAVLRDYLPKPEVLDGSWKAPPIQKVK
jgi:hypothetical protein